jgi:hypothetical protein
MCVCEVFHIDRQSLFVFEIVNQVLIFKEDNLIFNVSPL